MKSSLLFTTLILESIHSDILELPILSYKWIIIFLDNYFSYCNITFLYKKYKAVKTIKSIFQIWPNIISHPIKRLHTNNREEYII